MPQFLVTLYDGTDAEAPARRQATRPAHLDGLKGNVAAGKLVFGGPIFDDAQQPIGSFLLAECADRAELDAIIANDPYTKGECLAACGGEAGAAGGAGRQDHAVDMRLRTPGAAPGPPYLIAERQPRDQPRHQHDRDQDQREPQRQGRHRQRCRRPPR